MKIRLCLHAHSLACHMRRAADPTGRDAATAGLGAGSGYRRTRCPSGGSSHHGHSSCKECALAVWAPSQRG